MLSLRVSILNVAIEGFLAPRPAGREPAPALAYRPMRDAKYQQAFRVS
jgi:hypothetical protein